MQTDSQTNLQLHIASCPDAEKSFNVLQDRNLCSIAMKVNHLEHCTRCVTHLMAFEKLHCCTDKNCLRVKNYWKFRGDFNDCLFQTKQQKDSFSFEKIFKQLQILLELDFENIYYQTGGCQMKRADVLEPIFNNSSTVQSAAAIKTNILFKFLNLFRELKQNLESCDLKVDFVDLIALLQTMIEQNK